MTFTSPALELLRAARRQDEPHPSAAPEVNTAPEPRGKSPRPDMAARAASRGHCGTCRAFTLRPEEGRYMGECSHGWAAHYPEEGRRALPVIIHEAARCMTAPFPRWALRAGVKLAEPEAVTGDAV